MVTTTKPERSISPLELFSAQTIWNPSAARGTKSSRKSTT